MQIDVHASFSDFPEWIVYSISFNLYRYRNKNLNKFPVITAMDLMHQFVEQNSKISGHAKTNLKVSYTCMTGSFIEKDHG